MKFTRGHATTVAAVTVLAFALSSCSGQSAGTGAEVTVSGDSYDGPDVALTVWNPFTGADGPHFQTMVDEFNESQESITVTATSMPGSDLYGKIGTAIRADKGPDVAVIHVQNVASQVAQGNLLAIDNVVEALDLTGDDFAENVWDAAEYDDRRYSIPLDQHMYGLFINKEVYAEAGLDPVAPTDKDELIAQLDAFKAAGIQGFWQPTSDEWGFRTFLSQFGGSEFSEDGTEATFNSAAGVEALAWQRSLIDDGYSPENVDDPWKAFLAGENAMGLFGIWHLGDPALAEVDFMAAEVPQVGDQPGVWGSSHQLTITTQAEGDENKTAAAAYFVNYLSQNSLEWAHANQVPARKSVRESAEQELTMLQPFAAQIEDIAFNPLYPGLESSLTPLTDAINEVMTSGADPQEALDKAAEQTNAIIEDNRQKYGY
ncbi:ABC transporter substrate-binding protein [Microbacterium sp. dk485]|uniref:ABC transporter substrate-binding protein n=1 Tax=Microbacterium sp. dk485 TaxID=2560021 RepID=UPI001072FB95|nr:ABC transporter substrate-binding protein [Microbacterium sp. dk485]TFV81737.1 ABC transporter substrate-binding protein [Microbacterium sp. dk485]